MLTERPAWDDEFIHPSPRAAALTEHDIALLELQSAWVKPVAVPKPLKLKATPAVAKTAAKTARRGSGGAMMTPPPPMRHHMTPDDEASDSEASSEEHASAVKGGAINFDARLFLEGLDRFAPRRQPLVRHDDDVFDEWTEKWAFVHDFVDGKRRAEADRQLKARNNNSNNNSSNNNNNGNPFGDSVDASSARNYHFQEKSPFRRAPPPRSGGAPRQQPAASPKPPASHQRRASAPGGVPSSQRRPSRRQEEAAARDRANVEDLPDYFGKSTPRQQPLPPRRPSHPSVPPAAKRHGAPSSAPTKKTTTPKSAACAWEALEAKMRAATPLGYDDIPWPTGATVTGITQSDAPPEKKFKWQTALRRWHPDKFSQILGHIPSADDRARVLEKIKEVTRRVIGEKAKLNS